VRTRRIATAAALLGVAGAWLIGAGPAAAQCPSQDNLGYDSGGTPGSTSPNDPLYGAQWGLDQIQAPGAWARGAIGTGAVVAVVDTGVDYRHPDLAGQLLPGRDLAEEQCADGAQDENGHGTHVAGIVAALANNGIGVAGAAPGAKILPVRVLEPDGTASTQQMTDGVRWAADNGADVINLSIGENLPESAFESEQWTAATTYAYSRGAVIVAASGNDPIPVCESPSNSPNVICVAATDPNGFPTWYSSFPKSPNDGVQVRAPGGTGAFFCDDDVWSTYWPGAGDDDICGLRGYEPLAGTSMAAPHVSAVAAMLAGGALVLDEGNRMSEKSWASLAPLLDHRRYVESVVAGIKIHAAPDFRFVTTMNEDASTYELPEYIHSRLMPQIQVDFPEEDEERAILQAQVPYAEEEVLAYVLAFLRRAHDADLRYTVRDGINLVRYAMKLLRRGEAESSRDAVERALALTLPAGEREELGVE